MLFVDDKVRHSLQHLARLLSCFARRSCAKHAALTDSGTLSFEQVAHQRWLELERHKHGQASGDRGLQWVITTIRVPSGVAACATF